MWKWSDLKRILLRKAVSDTAELGAVMWPVVYPDMGDGYNPKDPHVTIVIFRDINNENLGFTKEDVIDVIQTTEHNVMLWLKPDGIEWFGADKDVPVLRVKHDYLYVYHTAIIKALAERGIPVDMTFPEYKPHVTITDAAALDGVIPDRMIAGPVELWWGDEHFTVPDDVKNMKIALNKDGSL